MGLAALQAMIPSELKDAFGRTARRLRLSVTDRCNFRCVYCMPADVKFMDHAEILTFEELTRLASLCAGLGVTKVRVTGGEPLARRGVPELVRQLKGVPGLNSVSITTNGVFLKDQGPALSRAGLTSVNISLDSLRRDRFTSLCRRDALPQVLEGIEAAKSLGFERIKLNCVVMRGINDDELVDFARLSREGVVEVRFIEFMPLDGDSIWNRDKVVPLSEILDRIQAEIPLNRDATGDPHDPARMFRFRDGRGAIGIIASVSQPFCGSCDRIRITADGKFRTCLFATRETDLKTPLREGASDEDLARIIADAVAAKAAGHLINSPSFEKPARFMYAIGG